MKVALVGTGLAGLSHALDIASNPDFDLVAVCARRRSRADALADQLVVSRRFDSTTEMLDSGCCEAVVVAVPPAVTLPIVSACIARGLLVLAEKPVGTVATDLDVVSALAESAPDRVLAPFNRRYLTHVRRAVEAVRGGAIGTVDMADAYWSGSFRSRYMPGAATYRAAASSRRGLLADTGSHMVDTLCWMLGDVRPLPGGRMTTNPRGADVGFDLSFQTADGGTVRARTDERRHDDWRVHVVGSRGTATMAPDCATVVTARGTTRLGYGEVRRPVDDLLAAGTGRPVYAAPAAEMARLSRILTMAYDVTAPDRRPRPRWHRPRFKPWGRLNGSC